MLTAHIGAQCAYDSRENGLCAQRHGDEDAKEGQAGGPQQQLPGVQHDGTFWQAPQGWHHPYQARRQWHCGRGDGCCLQGKAGMYRSTACRLETKQKAQPWMQGAESHDTTALQERAPER